MAVRERNSTWQVDFKVPGRPRVRQQGFTSREEAEAWELEQMARIKRGQEVTPPDRSNRSLTMRELADKVGKLVWAGQKAERTTTMKAEFVVRTLGPAVAVSSITQQTVDDLVEAMKDRGDSDATINRKLSALSVMLKWANKRGYLAAVPEIKLRKETEGRLRFLREDEEALWLARFRHLGMDYEADFFEFAVDTGARLGEVERVRLPDDLNGRVVTFWDTKSGKPRSVPLTVRALAALQRRAAVNPGQPFDQSRHTLQHRWERVRGLLPKAQKDVTIHTLRHTCCSRLVQRGVDLRRVQRWMGHKSITTTLRYAHLAPEDLNVCADVLEQRPSRGPQNVTQDVTQEART
ncbi:MAG: tyrosine-type recombinase/integrase [Ferrovibrio sp.]|uniref:tyrosine-type recombinase/integrase n=1 Tax=Ferrovibrio sp. TaxID=1917215 RepID=UPI00391AA28D